MYEIGAVREAAEGLEQATGQGRVDATPVTGAAGDYDPRKGGAPSRVADWRVQGRAGDIQVHHVQTVYQVRQTEQRDEPAQRDRPLLKKNNNNIKNYINIYVMQLFYKKKQVSAGGEKNSD